MFCKQCGGKLDPGKKFCTSCGAAQDSSPGGSQNAGVPGPGGTPRWVVVVAISLVALLAAGGLATGLFFLLRRPGKKAPVTDTGKKKTGTNAGEAARKLAYLDSGDISTVSMTGTDPARLTTRGDIVDFAVSPDGSRMAFVVQTGDQLIIYRMKADGSDVAQVTLPEKGLAENPVFDPGSRYIYFTRVTPADLSAMQEGRPHGVGFERYDIAANKVDHLYTYEGLQEQSIEGLWADPGGGRLFFNLFGSDYPSSVPHILRLGASPYHSAFLPMQTDTPGYTAIAYQLLDISPDGRNVAYYKQMLPEDPDPDSGGVRVDVCFRPLDGGAETRVDGYVPGESREGEITGMEFSGVASSRFFLSKVSSSSERALGLRFYQGDGPAATATELTLSLAVDPERYTPTVWQLVKVPR